MSTISLFSLLFLLLSHSLAYHLQTRSSATLKTTTRLWSSDEVSSLDKPAWAGDDVLSGLVNALITFKPLFGIMKVAARNTLISTAEKNGIPWRGRASQLASMQSELDALYASVEDKSVTYPSYYEKEFHAYDEGNTNWQAAAECESATMSMALRVWPKDGLTAAAAQDRLRDSFSAAVQAYMAEQQVGPPTKILDVGCSVGISTFYLARVFSAAEEVTGLDLSPHFLAVAKLRQVQEQGPVGSWRLDNLQRIQWRHAQMERSGLRGDEYSLTCACFVFHELPQAESRAILKEMHRVTEKGGVVAITDNNPRSQVIQNLPPVLFTLMKSTEPWSDQYYTFDLEGALEEAGFSRVKTVASDPRHRTVMAVKT